MQTEVDVGEFLVEYGPRVHQVPYKRVSAQTTTIGKTGRFGRFRSVESASAASLPKMQRTGLLLQKDPIDGAASFQTYLRLFFIFLLLLFYPLFSTLQVLYGCYCTSMYIILHI